MPKQPKQGKPLIDLRDDIPRELKVKVRGSVHDLIALYAEFYQHSDGFKPDDSKVVDGALKSFFDEEESFQDWLKKRPKVDGGSPRSAPITGARSAPSSAAPAS